MYSHPSCGCVFDNWGKLIPCAVGRDAVLLERVVSNVANVPDSFEFRVNCSKKYFLTGLIDPESKGRGFLLNI